VSGNVDPSKLSAGERALYDAITNKDVTGTLTVVGKDSSFDFEKSTGKGQNSLDRSDLNAMDKAVKSLSGEVIAHAALESYDSAKPGVSVDQAHTLASQFFGFQYSQALVSGMINFTVKGVMLDWRATRLNLQFRVRMTLKTPIPYSTFKKSTFLPPRDVTSVTIVPENQQ
jgi:hypothetical protein